MDFAFSEEQDAFRETLARFLEEKSPSTEVRRLMETPEGNDPGLWKQMAEELGLQGVHIPEAYGGQGFGFLELGLVVEEMGRALVCSPFFSSVCLATNAILNAGNDEQKRRWLPALASGETIGTLALLDTGIHPLKEGEPERRAEIVAFAYDHGMTALAERWLPGMVHPNRIDDQPLMAGLTEMVERMDPDLHARQINALVTRPDASNYVADIACPTLLVVGRQDQWSPLAQHEEVLRLMPHARLEVIEDAGHFAPVEQPDAVADLLRDWALN